MILAVNVCGVDASLLQGSFYCLLNLLSLGLLDSYCNLVVLYFLAYAALVDSNGSCRSDLHSDVLTAVGVRNGLVESQHSAQAVAVHVVVGSYVLALDNAVAVQLHLLAGDTATSDNSVLDGAVAHGQSLNLVQSLATCSNCSVQNLAGQSHEISVGSNEVGLALQGDDSSKAILSLYQYATLGSLAVATLCGNSSTLLAEVCYCTVHILALSQSLLTVGQTSTGHLAELLDVSHCNFHSRMYFIC